MVLGGFTVFPALALIAVRKSKAHALHHNTDGYTKVALCTAPAYEGYGVYNLLCSASSSSLTPLAVATLHLLRQNTTKREFTACAAEPA